MKCILQKKEKKTKLQNMQINANPKGKKTSKQNYQSSDALLMELQ